MIDWWIIEQNMKNGFDVTDYGQGKCLRQQHTDMLIMSEKQSLPHGWLCFLLSGVRNGL